MPFVYVERYQMAIDLRAVSVPVAPLPVGFHFLEWHPAFLERHAKTKYISFCREIDAKIFPTFRQYDACLRLMQSIAGKPEFLPQATWLIVKGEPFQEIKDCATIQGLRHNQQTGAIQNVAVAPEFRRLGLGRALVLQALRGFQNAGTENVALEVTAENLKAVNLYKTLGFKIVKSVYKETVM
ncbi:MAG: GNAT family N-acetyltransferase [Planctomycetaceae bacterium]|jgi:ribosomal protein S18 acetylase RimI-like enzyme|nr:GNAT family N-acetyltransferase [Planctomycetaceae bacterium]